MKKSELEWKKYMKSVVENHFDGCEVNFTTLGEDCADHYNLLSESGRTEVEERIFELAVDVADVYMK
jgi:hypothetical protein